MPRVVLKTATAELAKAQQELRPWLSKRRTRFALMALLVLKPFDWMARSARFRLWLLSRQDALADLNAEGARLTEQLRREAALAAIDKAMS